MDPIVSGVINFKQAETMSRVQYAVARKLLDSQQLQGDAVLELLNAAAKNFAGAGDQLVAATMGLGGQLDTYA